MAKVLTAITVDAPTGSISVAPSDTFAFTGTPTLTGGGGVQRYDFKWEVDSGGGYVTIASSGTGLITADTNPLINTNSQTANSITVTADATGTYTIRMVGAPTSGGSYTVISDTRSVTVLNAYALAADSGTYSQTGQAATITKAHVLPADNGSYSLTGQNATITYTPVSAGYEITADSGTYTLTGQSSQITHDVVLAAASGTYAVTGQSAVLAKGLILVAESGNYTVTGQTATIAQGYVLTADSGTYSISGQAATIRQNYVLAAGSGTYSVSGQVASVYVDRVLDAFPGTYTKVGRAATITYASIYPDPSYVLAGITYGPGGIYTGTLDALTTSVKVDLVSGKLVKPINDKVVMTL